MESPASYHGCQNCSSKCEEKAPLVKRGMTILLILSLVANGLFVAGFGFWRQRPLTSSHAPEFNTEMSFGESDLRYQSLNYAYDDLWSGKFSIANGSGILDLPDSEHKEGLQKLGGIAM